MPRARVGNHPATTDVMDYSYEELEWLRAVDRYCVQVRRRWLLNCEYLAILKSLGYRKRAPVLSDFLADGCASGHRGKVR